MKRLMKNYMVIYTYRDDIELRKRYRYEQNSCIDNW